jgi:hypothetical protein
VCREKSAEHYLKGGGKERKAVSNYLRRYKLDRSFLSGCETVEDELTRLKSHALYVKSFRG